MPSQRVSYIFYYTNPDCAVAVLLELPQIEFCILHSTEQVRDLERRHGIFKPVGSATLPSVSDEPLQRLSGPAALPLLKAITTLQAARQLVPLLPPHRFLRQGVVWTEIHTAFCHCAIVVTHQQNLSQLAMVFSVSQLLELIHVSYKAERKVFEAIQATARLPQRPRNGEQIFVVSGPLAADLIQGLIMAKELPLPAGV